MVAILVALTEWLHIDWWLDIDWRLPQDDEILFSAVLQKKSSGLKSWKSRRFVVERGHLHWFSTRGSKSQRGELELGCVVKVVHSGRYIDIHSSSSAPILLQGTDVVCSAMIAALDRARARG